jgi:hypothetical protein
MGSSRKSSGEFVGSGRERTGKSRGEPCLDTRETRFAIVFILQDRYEAASI